MRAMLLVGVFAAAAVSNVKAADDDIVFARKNFAELGDFSVGISGTLTGEGVAYKNNTFSIFCNKEKQECLIASIEQIGDKQMGRLDYAYSYPITKWNAYEVVATEEATDWGCSKTTITLVRKSQTALWVQEPVNQTRPHCARSDTKIHKWTIEDSPGWRKLFGK